MVLTQLRTLAVHYENCYRVSIPLWFLRNSARFHYLLPSTQVSIPLWFLRNELTGFDLDEIEKFPYHYGSYATEIPEGLMLSAVYRFHTTMVLTQLRENHSGIKSKQGFHTTMVLTQRYGKRLEHGPGGKFPYHYGSYATQAS